MPTPRIRAFCDWLDVTYPPDDFPYPALNSFLLDLEFEVERDRGGAYLYIPPAGRGVVKLSASSRWAKASLSGGACGWLREASAWEEILFLLGTSPHRVTRLDSAVDLACDAADFIADLRSRYPSGVVHLGRKGLAVSVMLSVRGDGRESGTFYVGHRSAARQTLRVYDKSLELLQKYGEFAPPTTRVEVTARKDCGATLRDAAMPDSLFWHIACPSVLVKRPEDVPMWDPNSDETFSAPAREIDPVSILRRRIEGSAELDALMALADSIGSEGRRLMLKELEGRLFPTERAAKRAEILQLVRGG